MPVRPLQPPDVAASEAPHVAASDEVDDVASESAHVVASEGAVSSPAKPQIKTPASCRSSEKDLQSLSTDRNPVAAASGKRPVGSTTSSTPIEPDQGKVLPLPTPRLTTRTKADVSPEERERSLAAMDEAAKQVRQILGGRATA
jgi:hypothetical protein